MLKYFKYLLYMVIPIVIGIIFLTVLDYLGLFNSNILKVFKIILILSSTFVSSYLLGKNSKNKGYLEGLKLGGLFILILFIINMIIGKFKLYILLYYSIILITSIFGSTVGINLKRNN